MKLNYYVSIAMACLLMASCGDKKDSSKTSDVIRVTTELAALTHASISMPYVGTVQAEGSTLVSFNGTGILRSVNVSEGQHVTKGQLLATVDDSQAQHMLAVAKASLDQANDAEQRMRQLHESGSLPDIKWIEVQSQVQQARAAYAMAQKQIDDCRIYATSSGVVDSKILSVGENVLPTEPVLRILNVDQVKVQVSVPEREISHIQPDMTSLLTIEALGGQTFVGGTIEKGVSADPLTHTYNIYIHVSNLDGLLMPGMVASVQLAGAEAEPRLTVPVRAVQQSVDKTLFVWVIDGGRAVRVPVELGALEGNRVAICGGQLREGQQVVVEGFQKLSEGDKVTSNNQ